ncbi:MAG: hypothetical protein ACLU0O_08530 [Collinsella sp.]
MAVQDGCIQVAAFMFILPSLANHRGLRRRRRRGPGREMIAFCRRISIVPSSMSGAHRQSQPHGAQTPAPRQGDRAHVRCSRTP